MFQTQALRDKSVLIVMNKNDLSDVTKVATLTSIMRMDDILHKSPCRWAQTHHRRAIPFSTVVIIWKTKLATNLGERSIWIQSFLERGYLG